MTCKRTGSIFYAIAVLLALLVFPLLVQAQSKIVAELSVHSGKFARSNVPVSTDLKGVSLQKHVGTIQLYEITAGADHLVASQLVRGRLSWILSGDTAPGTVRNYELRAREQSVPTPSAHQVTVDDDGDNLHLRIGDKPVLSYRYSVQPVPAGVDEIFSRSGFIHPIWSPGGEILSRIQPPDHRHHYGLWNPWTHTRFEGRQVDFWNIGEGQGTVRAVSMLEKTEGELAGGFKALLDHVDFTGPDGEKVVLNETWEIKIWNADPERKTWLVDFVSILSPATEEPLIIEAYRYQGFSLRATEKWNDETATLLTSEGYDKSNGNGTRARWLDVNGVANVPDGTSGILIMTHPGNFNYPEQIRIWPTGMEPVTENVFINFNPAQDRDFVLAPGTSHKLAYRMLIYDGKMDPDAAERYWRDFANPPRVDVHRTGALEGASILVYTRNGEGFVHENIPYSITMIEALGKRYGFSVEASDDPSLFTEQNLARYDALVFSNTNNEAFDTDAQREALQSYIRNGGGFVGLHSASGSERDWPWFSRLLGGNFERHAPSQDFTVDVIDRAHPSTSFLPDRWDIENDECYYLKELSPGIRVLLAADLTTVTDERRAEFPGKLFGDSFPIAWYQEFDGGRQWYTALGHRPEEYSDPQLMRHILGGIRWVVGGLSP